MKAVFADSHYWVAIVNPNDQWKGAAKSAKSLLGDVIIVTTDEVLTEFLTALSRSEYWRRRAAGMVRIIMENLNVKVVPQTRDSFLKGLSLYENRNDKEYSLTDCISMNVMKTESINEILTNDHHFEQEGYSVLMKDRLS
jgi:predicted nucleic acid-binding protein